MSQPNYPTFDPAQQPEQETFCREPAYDPVLRPDEDAGLEGARARHTQVPLSWTFLYRGMTGGNKDLLLTFWRDTCTCGAVVFQWTDPTDSAAYFVRFTDRPQDELEPDNTGTWTVKVRLRQANGVFAATGTLLTAVRSQQIGLRESVAADAVPYAAGVTDRMGLAATPSAARVNPQVCPISVSNGLGLAATPSLTQVNPQIWQAGVTDYLGLTGSAAGASSGGGVYYLNTTSGSDGNPGTSGQPWASLDKVDTACSEGDIVVIQDMDAATYALEWPTKVTWRAAVIKQFSITWTFNTQYVVGQFANLDFWVVGPVTLYGISPASVLSGGRIKNGSMVNPAAGWVTQGYDNAMSNVTYEAAKNVAFNVSSSNPLALPVSSSLVSTISLDTAGNLPQLQRAAVLTVLAAAPAAGSFRPPYCGTNKQISFNASGLNYGLLRSLSPVGTTPSLSAIEANFAAPWLDHIADWVGRYSHPSLNMPDYGYDMNVEVSDAALMLHLDYTNEQKATLMIRFVQLGIDLCGVATNGGLWNWVGAGGQAGGRKWPILFAGLVLNDSAMKAVGAKSGDYLWNAGYGPGNPPPDYIHFGEDDQTFYVAQFDVDITHGPAWNPDSRDAEKYPYETSDIGLPEWGIRHSDYPQQSNKWWWTYYRYAGAAFNGCALAALMTTGAKALWNNDAYFDYTDRFAILTHPGGLYNPDGTLWWHSGTQFAADMWDTYRSAY